ncbi:MAG: DUF1993 domain-containing protein [Luteimonas sp.]
MSLSMYQASVPVLQRALSNLRGVLEKAEAHAVEHGIAPEVLLQTRLMPDMYPLLRQVQIASDLARIGASRLAGAEPVKIDDVETTFAQLYERIARASAQIDDYTAAQIDGSETRSITIKTRSGELTFAGQAYLLDFLLPNLFFHCVTAYAILRQSGMALGKMDFMGRPG